MRKGFSVCANACRCQALLPRKLRFSATFKRRFATLLNFEIFAEYCHVSPARNGDPASAPMAFFFVPTGGLETSPGEAGMSFESAIPPSLGPSATRSGFDDVLVTAADAREISLWLRI